MQIRNKDAYHRWWKEANQNFPARKIALIHAEEWAEQIERQVQFTGGMIPMDFDKLGITEDPHAFWDGVLFLKECWAYGHELYRQILRSGIPLPDLF